MSHLLFLPTPHRDLSMPLLVFENSNGLDNEPDVVFGCAVQTISPELDLSRRGSAARSNRSFSRSSAWPETFTSPIYLAPSMQEPTATVEGYFVCLSSL